MITVCCLFCKDNEKKSEHIGSGHGNRKAGQLWVERLAHFQGQDEIRVHVDFAADAHAQVHFLRRLLVQSQGGRQLPVLFAPELPRDGGDVEERVEYQVEVLAEEVELEEPGPELEVAPCVTGGRETVQPVASDGVAAAQALGLLVLVGEGGNLGEVVPGHLPGDLVLEPQVVGESQPAENDRHEVAEMGHDLRVMVGFVGKVRIADHVQFCVQALVGDPFHVTAVIGEAGAPFQGGASGGFLIPDEASRPVVPVQGEAAVVVVLREAVVQEDAAENPARHPAEPAVEGALQGKGRADGPPVVRVIGRTGLLVQIQFLEVRGMEAVEAVEVVQGGVPVGERSRQA